MKFGIEIDNSYSKWVVINANKCIYLFKVAFNQYKFNETITMPNTKLSSNNHNKYIQLIN